MKVAKFGGTSMSHETIQKVKYNCSFRSQSPSVIVVSALGKRTSDDDKVRLTLFDLCLPSASC